MDIDEKTFSKIIKAVASALGFSEKEKDIVKSLDSEKREALFVVLSPEEVDLHGDIYSEEEVEKACDNFNTHCRQANLLHQIQTDSITITQSYVTPTSFTTDKGVEIKKGAWVAKVKFKENDPVADVAFDMVKQGKLTGLSIGGRATVEDLSDGQDSSGEE